MRIARNPKTGKFPRRQSREPGRPPRGEMTKAQLKRQRDIIAAWRAQAREGVDLIQRRRNALSKINRGICPGPSELLAIQCSRVDGETR
jgi:hypothetical protein